jgi:Holliday junction resolvase-like predicted endonuclease
MLLPLSRKRKLKVTTPIYMRQAKSSHRAKARLDAMNMYQADECKS